MKSKKYAWISFLGMSLIILSISTGCMSKNMQAAKAIEAYVASQQQLISTYENIDSSKLDVRHALSIIVELTSEKYKGRKTGTKENEMAAQYISDYFKAIGLKNPEGLTDYKQYYSQSTTQLKETPKLVIIDKQGKPQKEFKYPNNFSFRVLSDSTEDIRLQVPLQAVGQLNELQGDAFEDQPALLFSLKTQGKNSMLQIMNRIYHTKASAVILEVDISSQSRQFSQLLVTTLSKKNWGETYKPVITVDSETYKELLEAAAEHKNIDIECSYSFDDHYQAANIVGVIPGADEKLRDQYIIFGAHFDHVGDNLNGTYNPGALDNASGVAAMMELARVLTENPKPPGKTILFIAFNGEEYTLCGSDYYASNPVFPLDDAVMINLDMVGSAYPVPLSISTAPEHVPDLKLEFLALARALGMDSQDATFTASDHFSFGEKGVPAVYLAHMDDGHGMHSPMDTIDKIDENRLKEVLELVLHYIDRKSY